MIYFRGKLISLDEFTQIVEAMKQHLRKEKENRTRNQKVFEELRQKGVALKDERIKSGQVTS